MLHIFEITRQRMFSRGRKRQLQHVLVRLTEKKLHNEKAHKENTGLLTQDRNHAQQNVFIELYIVDD